MSRNMISYEVDSATKKLWDTIKAHPKAGRGFHTTILTRLLQNFLADFGNWENEFPLDDDLRYKFERYRDQHNETKGLLLKLETQRMIYWSAMQTAFECTNIPILIVKLGNESMDEFTGMIRSKVFENSEGELSVPNDLIKDFLHDAIQRLEASGEMNRLRCEEQMKEYGDNVSFAEMH